MKQEWICLIALAVFSQLSIAEPIIIQEPQSRAAAEGKRVEFAVQAQSPATIKYQWQFNGVDIPRAVGRTLAFTATASRAGNYSVIVRDDSGARSSSPAALQVQKRPAIVKQPKHQIVGEHQSAIFDVTVNDSGPYTYLNWWHHSPEEPHHEIPENTLYDVHSFHFAIPDVNNNGTYNGVYWFAVSNSVGGATSRRASLVVVGPPRLTSEPQDLAVRAGRPAKFSVTIAPDVASKKTQQWYWNGEPIPGATGKSLRIAHVQPDKQGLYHCVVTSIGGSTSSYQASLTVY
ncbi:MAG TPA: immunoglobulin domain-containing protein [Candidatus Limnocylindria bacterium]|nr:immunoglobulin domain-containing protein [Candidatus Limnocylindria bacterium]